VSDERLDARPVEERARRHATTEWARQQPSHAASWSRVDADDAPPAFDARELDLVDTHQARVIHVDQLMVEHVVLEQHLFRAALETSQVEQQDTARRQIG
jgi:hypothetical protein